MDGLRSAHGFLQRRVAAELTAQAHADARLHLRRLRRPLAADPGRCSSENAGTRSERLQRRRRVARAAARRDRALAALPARHAREPRRRRARLARRHAARARPRSARTPSPTWRPTSSRCPTSTASSQVENLVTEPPADLEERTIVFLDCGNIDRNPADSLKRDGAHILNVDHHHDNTQFGTVNHVVPEASCTAEVIWDLMEGLGRARRRSAIAEALYVGLVTDTGKFMYENTGPRAHEMAADLIEAGVDVHAIYRRLFEGVPQGKLELLARGLSNVERFDDGLLTRHPPDARRLRRHRRRRELTPRASSTTCARSQGTAMAGLVRDLLNGDRPSRSGARSRCAPPTTASTSRRSRAPRAAAATAAPPASRPRWSSRSSSSSCAPSLAEQLS